MTPLLTVAIVATAILGLAYFGARALREGLRAVDQYRRDCAEADAAAEWDVVVIDAQRIVAYGRHPISQRRSVAGLWRAMYPRERVHPILRLIGDDR